jgi:hypothetical protein
MKRRAIMTRNKSLRIPTRETFGVIDSKTGQLYSDLISFTLSRESLRNTHLLTTTVRFNSVIYRLHMDSKLKQALRKLGIGETVEVIISYQIRDTINIALARLLDFSKINSSKR